MYHDFKDLVIGRDRNMQAFYGNFLHAGDLVFDVGANVGQRSKIFSRLGCRVVAVEPHRECARNLQARFRFNSNVRVEPLALSAREGEATFYESELLTVSTLSREFIELQERGGLQGKWNSGVKVATSTIDSLVKKYGVPSFIKIDVEGAEVDVLRGLTQPMPRISIEFHANQLDEARKCIEYLRESVGPYWYNYCMGEDTSFALPSFVSGEEFLRSTLPELERHGRSYGDIYAWHKSRLPTV